MGLLFALLLLAACAPAQDPFEIQIYEYQTVPKGMFNLETHLNYTGKGSKLLEGTVAPTNNQSHMTYELTRGIANHFEMAGYLVLAMRPGTGQRWDYVGWRVRPRVSIPRSWRLPVDVSIAGEVGFPRKAYDENSSTLEIRPIIEKTLGRWQLDLNPVVGRALRGPGTKDGWDFEPGVRVGYGAAKIVDLSLEYYGATGPVTNPLPRREQVHLFFPGADLQITENIVWNLGIGLAATSAGNHLIYKTRIGVMFGRRNRP